MTGIDEGLLSPVTVGHDDPVSDAAVLDALVATEVALVRAWGAIGVADPGAVTAVSKALGWQGRGKGCRGHGVAVEPLAQGAVAGGNPVIPLVRALRAAVPDDLRAWVHRGATSQDILDTALMMIAREAAGMVDASLHDTETALAQFARDTADVVAAARTLTQHAVPTTVGARAAAWLRGVQRARTRLADARRALPAQLGGAGGTQAAFVEIAQQFVDAAEPAARADEETAEPGALVERLTAAFAAETGLAQPDAPWHVTRWPVTELGDALVQTIDALGKLAADVATLSRTEIGELAHATGGGSSAMPQKQNPTAAVLIRSAALRAPQLGATLHLAAALAVDERPDGAWHAEWPTLRELLRLALGASAHAVTLVGGLRLDREAVARNLALTRGLVVAERLSVALGAILGSRRGEEAAGQIVADVSTGADLAARVRTAAEAAGVELDVDALIDPANYTGRAGESADAAGRAATTQAEPADAARMEQKQGIQPASVPEEEQ